MVELRKRKTPPPAPVRPAKRSAAPRGKKTAAADKKTAAADKKAAAADKTPVEKATKVASETVEAVTEAVSEAVEAVKEAVTGTDSANGTAEPAAALKVGDTIDLATFGGEVETHDGTKTTLKQLVEASKGGVVLFTYPKASTPGCTTQVCLFRDSFAPLTATGFDIFGLSNDSPKANTTFKTKQKLPYTLLCDPAQTLIAAIGLKKTPKGTTRGVFVVNKAGKVLLSEPGSPAGTHAAVKKLVEDSAAEGDANKGDAEAAETAAEVADTAAKVDSNEA
jgi:peroxiredoxin Q/BCP